MEKGNLLLIDDEVLLLEKTAMLLEDIADDVYTSDNGPGGLELLKSKDVHCIICDINMPNMNGVEVLEKVRETHPDIPFIFYTGHGSRELMKKAIRFGAFDFIDKPCLDGLEDIAIRGLMQGLGKNPMDQVTDDADSSSFESEYHKLIKQKD